MGAILQIDYDWAVAHPDLAGGVPVPRPSEDAKITAFLEAGMCPSELEKGYKEAVNDIALHFFEADEDGTPDAISFFEYYTARTGRQIWDDAGHPGKAAKAIVRRGAIRDTVEWRLLNNVLSNVDQTVFSGDALNRAEALLGEFEALGWTEED
ncbi:MAG: hypothetical protein AAF771_15305 [Pseudomonadota bacterium]